MPFPIRYESFFQSMVQVVLCVVKDLKYYLQRLGGQSGFATGIKMDK
jgi:hypothetical protein